MENKKGMRVFTAITNAIIFLLIISVAFLPEISAAAVRRGHAKSRVAERPASPSPLASPPLNKKVAASPHGGGVYHPLPDPY